MSPTTSPILKARGTVAALTRSRALDDPDLVNAKRSLAAANLERYVSTIVAAAPALTDEQVERIAALLRPTAGGVPA